MHALSTLARDSARRRTVSALVSTGYAWMAMLAFSAIAVETVVIYPNVFRDVPDSLARASAFFTVTGPADFFPPLGLASLVTGVVTLLVSWPVRQARCSVGAGLAVWAVADFAFSVLYFWPRNEILFTQGAAEHSVETLARVAVEFETGHWGRLAGSAVTSAFAFAAMWHCLRHRFAAGPSTRGEAS